MNTTLQDEEADVLMQDLLDGTLTGADAARAEARLNASPRHAAQLQAHRALQAGLRGLRNPEVPAGFEARVAARVEAQQRLGLAGLWSRLVEHWRIPTVVGAALAAGLALVWTAPAQQDGASSGVGAAAVAGPQAVASSVTLRLRAPVTAWPRVVAALQKAGVQVSAPAADAVTADAVAPDAAALGRAVGELGALSSVETVGTVPSMGAVRVRVQLLTP